MIIQIKSMIIQIKMEIKRNYAIIKYFKFYIAVIVLVIKKKELDYFIPTPIYLIM